jgi:hypothetical protein
MVTRRTNLRVIGFGAPFQFLRALPWFGVLRSKPQARGAVAGENCV